MFTQQDVDILRNALPLGSITELERRTRISRTTIYKFLNGERIKGENKNKIYLEGLRIVEENQKVTAEIIAIRNRLAQNGLDVSGLLNTDHLWK